MVFGQIRNTSSITGLEVYDLNRMYLTVANNINNKIYKLGQRQSQTPFSRASGVQKSVGSKKLRGQQILDPLKF